MVGCIHLKMRTPDNAVYPIIQYKERKVKRVKRKRKREKPSFKLRPKEAELCIKSLELGGIPWVRLKAIILCIVKVLSSSSKDFINYEGALPFGFELILFLLQEA